MKFKKLIFIEVETKLKTKENSYCLDQYNVQWKKFENWQNEGENENKLRNDQSWQCRFRTTEKKLIKSTKNRQTPDVSVSFRNLWRKNGFKKFFLFVFCFEPVNDLWTGTLSSSELSECCRPCPPVLLM